MTYEPGIVETEWEDHGDGKWWTQCSACGFTATIQGGLSPLSSKHKHQCFPEAKQVTATLQRSEDRWHDGVEDEDLPGMWSKSDFEGSNDG